MSKLLTKSKIQHGMQCKKLLWFTAHEAQRSELVPSEFNEFLIQRGRAVENYARRLFSEGKVDDSFKRIYLDRENLTAEQLSEQLQLSGLTAEQIETVINAHDRHFYVKNEQLFAEEEVRRKPSKITNINFSKNLYKMVDETTKVVNSELVKAQADRVVYIEQHTPEGEPVLYPVAMGDVIDAHNQTVAEIENNAVIFEASFYFDGIFIAADVIQVNSDGTLNLFEVKSANSLKDHQIHDLAIQHYVITNCGFTIRQAAVITLRPEYYGFDPTIPVEQYPAYKIEELFQVHDLSEVIQPVSLGKAATVAQQKLIIESSVMPDEVAAIKTSSHCNKPIPCPMKKYCKEKEPQQRVTELYRVNYKTLDKFRAKNIDLISQIPEGMLNSEIQRRQFVCATNGLGYDIDADGLKEALKQVKFPASFLDFEAVIHALPPYKNMKTWSQVPLQFSNHQVDIINKKMVIRHDEYLARYGYDPRREFAERLIQSCQNSRSVVVFYAPFEKTRMRELGEEFPDLAYQLAEISDKVVDLLDIVRDFFYHNDLKGSYSIKKVLPVLVPHMSYEGLVIPNGEQAMAVLYNLLSRKNFYSPSEEARYRFEVLKYCEQDTKAMVEIYRILTMLAYEDITVDELEEAEEALTHDDIVWFQNGEDE